MRITTTHHAVLCYLEWHCDRGLAFRTVRRMAADLARNETEVQRATQQLVAWGLISMRHDGNNQFHVVRLGDGRETRSHKCIPPAKIYLFQRNKNHTLPPISTENFDRTRQGVGVESRHVKTRIAI